MKNHARQIVTERLAAAALQTKSELEAFKRRIAKELKIPYPDNMALLAILEENKSAIGTNYSKLKELLKVRPVRSLSGIINVSVLTKAYPCPGNCLYCPNEPGFPKSYLSGEPAAERARLLKFNPYVQTRKRLGKLAAEGHDVEKVELRVIGGTWSYYPKAYQKKFIAACFAACNDFGKPKDKYRPLENEQKNNEAAKCRIVGISVETRPDHIDKKEIINLRRLGVTRVELGIQSIFDDVLDLNCRGHKIEAAVNATKILKNAGFKVSYQIMLNLYGSTPERDLAMAKILFSDPNFCPDLLKIYPCAVLKEAPLYRLYEQKKYKPYSDKKLVEVVKEIKKIMPPWVRIERIIRDIPSPRITSGTKEISNLRQTIARDMECEGWACQCIRCREVKSGYDPNEKIILVRRDYMASDGKEIFLSFENENKTKLFSLLRLRIPNNTAPVLPVLRDAALVREIHTYGRQTGIGREAVAAQHMGLGKRLIREAERTAKKESNVKKIAAIAGVGARAYWKKNGYKLRDTYMIKNL